MFLIKTELRFLKKWAWDVGENIRSDDRRIRCIMRGSFAVCFLNAGGFGEFLLGRFERKNQFKKYVLRIQVLCWRIQNMVFLPPGNFLFSLRKRYTINIYDKVYCSHPYLLDIFMEIWLDIRLTKKRLCVVRGKEPELWSGAAISVAPQLISFPSFPISIIAPSWTWWG